eukprot:338485_1
MEEFNCSDDLLKQFVSLELSFTKVFAKPREGKPFVDFFDLPAEKQKEKEDLVGDYQDLLHSIRGSNSALSGNYFNRELYARIDSGKYGTEEDQNPHNSTKPLSDFAVQEPKVKQERNTLLDRLTASSSSTRRVTRSNNRTQQQPETSKEAHRLLMLKKIQELKEKRSRENPQPRYQVRSSNIKRVYGKDYDISDPIQRLEALRAVKKPRVSYGVPSANGKA